MAYRLLVIRCSSSTPGILLHEPWRLEDTYQVDFADWDWSRPSSLTEAGADLIVPVAIDKAGTAVKVFEWLSGHPLTTPILAVIPEDAEPDLFRIASEVVDDFVVAPLRPHELRERIGRLLGPRTRDVSAIRVQLLEEAGLANLVGREPVFVQTLEKIPIVARCPGPVLITGETGTGKELCARAIHHVSSRRNSPFIPVDCGAIPEHLIENELFGHVRGAFTDARQDQRGLITIAEGGTLFIDEIDALSLAAQAKLLRFFQEHTFRPLGAEQFLKADVRIVAATNRDLELLVREGRFRKDLYFRLDVIRLHMPALRERRGDIPMLARHLLRLQCVGEHSTRHKSFSLAAVRALVMHQWPGNIRELAGVVQRAVVFSPGTQILPSDLFPRAATALPGATQSTFSQARLRAIQEFETSYVTGLLQKHEGNVTRAAREANKDRRAFGRLIKRYNINRLSV